MDEKYIAMPGEATANQEDVDIDTKSVAGKSKRRLNPSTKPINLILKTKGSLKLDEVRANLEAISEFGDVAHTLDSPRLEVDWEMTSKCVSCINLEAIWATLKQFGTNKATYIPIKLRADSRTLAKERIVTAEFS